jgi:cellulose synthase/poly-beta-1,6-N-acetylglucosamine synthase-like glycosyltransferase
MNTTLDVIGFVLVLAPVLLFGYAYFGYPLLLRLVSKFRPDRSIPGGIGELPTISITIPAYNEERSIADTLDRILAVEYPAERRQILIVSDASTDRTDEIVRSYADRGVELLRMPQRTGKTAAENAASALLRGDIVVNMDATIGLRPDSIMRLVRAFQDPTIGVASGRDVSVAAGAAATASGHEMNSAESGYVGYEMGLRDLETRVGTIVGASGCFYAIRRELVQPLFPGALSRDFAAPLIAHEAGFRSVSVSDALCLVPRTQSLDAEFRRKIRTMARGLDTLEHKAHLLNPLRHGVFAWMLISHKLCRWLVFLLLPGLPVGLALLVGDVPLADWALVVLMAGAALGLLGWKWPFGGRAPRILALAGFALASCVAGFIAWTKLFRNERNPIWEPTRRTT